MDPGKKVIELWKKHKEKQAFEELQVKNGRISSKEKWKRELELSIHLIEPAVERVRELATLSLPLDPEQRGIVYKIVLGVYGNETTAESFEETVNQIALLPRDELMSSECLEMCREMKGTSGEFARSGMETVLHVFCTTKSVMYVSGMARIVAPFFLLGFPLSQIVDCLYKLCATYMPQFVTAPTELDERRQKEQLHARRVILNHLLSYHAPQLAQVLTQAYPDWATDVVAQDIWFSTFSYDTTSCKNMLILLDHFLLYQDPEFSLFLPIGLILRHEQELLDSQTIPADLQEFFRTGFVTDEDVRVVSTIAGCLYRKTPASYTCLENGFGTSTSEACTDHSFNVQLETTDQIDMSEWEKRESKTLTGKIYWVHLPTRVTQWEHPEAKTEPPPQAFCLGLSAQEVAACFCGGGNSPTRRDLKFFLVDCRAFRSSDDMKCGRIPSAYTLDPSVFDDPDQIDQAEKALLPLRGRVHICLIGHGIGIPPQLTDTDELKSAVREAVRTDISALNRAALFFQKLRFRFVSHIQGGYSAWHAFMRDSPDSSPDELVGHESSGCKYCRYDILLRTGQDPFYPAEDDQGGSFGKASLLPKGLANLSLQDYFSTGKTDGRGLKKKHSSGMWVTSDETDDEEFEVELPQLSKA